MIKGISLLFTLTAVTGIIAVLPPFALPSGIKAAFVLMWSYLNMFSFLFPVDTLLTVLLLALLYHSIFWVFDVSLWAIGLMHRAQ